MEFPLEITFRQLERSSALEAQIRALAAQLDGSVPRIAHCDVVVEHSHEPHPHGNLCRVGLVLALADGDTPQTHRLTAEHAHVDVYVALRDAFDALRRELHRHRECSRG